MFRASLTTKLSLLVTGTVLLMLAVLAVYFDNFLKDSFLESTQKRMQHGFNRLAYNLRHLEQELREGVAFIRTDEGLIASIELINRYQDKDDYNTFLIDEEKKTIAAELLDRVKLSFNDDIAIYDHSEELVAFVIRHGGVYESSFVSYETREPRIYNRFENQAEYQPSQRPLPENVARVHTNFYNPDQVRNESFITRRRLGDDLVIQAHQSLIDEGDGRFIAHIELSRLLGDAYFEQMSRNLDIDLSLSFDEAYQGMAAPLEGDAKLPTVAVHQADQEYLGVMSLDTTDGKVFFIARMDKAAHNRALDQSRHGFLALLTLVAVGTLVLMRYLINAGLARPLGSLMQQIGLIERGDYATSRPLATGDELEAISTSVNQLATAVQEREASLEESRKELRYLSNHDALTDLPNRRYFSERLHNALETSTRHRGSLAVLFLDLDNFKIVNDTLGHDIGDELLVQVAERLRTTAGDGETLARIGGDEFNILVESAPDRAALEDIVAGFLQLFGKPFQCTGHEIGITASVGVSIYPKDGEDCVTLIKNADLAMYKSKDSGRNGYSFFSSELSEEVRQRAEMTHALQEAIKAGDQFELYYQPKMSLKSGRISAVEALIRWNSPTFGRVTPGQFIPLAEETGLIVPIGAWVLRQGCEALARLLRDGIELDHISINLSSVQMRHDDILASVRETIEQTAIRPDQLELEITERYIATDVDEAITTLRSFRRMGVRLAVDDFGTGYSSMSYLQKLPVTRIKVDKSFVDGLPHNHDSVAITRAIISLAKSFHLEVTAEGTEHQGQVEFLLNEGCDEIQGYCFAKPMPLADLKRFCGIRTRDSNVISLDLNRA